MKLSSNKEYTKAQQIVLETTISMEMRNSLWNVYMILFVGIIKDKYKNGKPLYNFFLFDTWINFFKKPMYEVTFSQIEEHIRRYFFECSEKDVLKFLETANNGYGDKQFVDKLNIVLERELSTYRFVNGVCTCITNKDEIELIIETLNDNAFPNVNRHLEQALQLMGNRDNPDYRNSIKESISAVESIAKLISGKPKATLGEALRVLEAKHNLHPALARGFENIYGYTSNADGIRHALIDESSLNANDAKFFLLSCTSFINYLKTKI